MDTDLPTVPECCAQCSHLDRFHATCSHPFRQIIVGELDDGSQACPVFAEVRAEAMHDLEDRLDDLR